MLLYSFKTELDTIKKLRKLVTYISHKSKNASFQVSSGIGLHGAVPKTEMVLCGIVIQLSQSGARGGGWGGGGGHSPYISV